MLIPSSTAAAAAAAPPVEGAVPRLRPGGGATSVSALLCWATGISYMYVCCYGVEVSTHCRINKAVLEGDMGYEWVEWI